MSEHPLHDRRTFMGAGLGAAALMTMLDSTKADAAHHEEENEFAAVEKANEKIVNEFCAAWATMDTEKIGEHMADDCVFRMLENRPITEGKEAILGGTKTFLANAKSAEFEVLRSHAMGNIVINDRIDRFDTGGNKMVFHIVGIFYVADGKIKEWRDYSMPKV